jgi:hypothetical protein
MKKIRVIAVLGALILTIGGFAFSNDIKPLSELKIGMKGIGKTIFKGSEIEEFKFEIIGFLGNFLPKKKLIIVKIDSDVLKGGGILEGMSGSPLYIDGKIIGAVAYGLTSYPKEAIGGVTPIEDILKVSKYDNIKVQIDFSDLKFKFDSKNALKISHLIERELFKRMGVNPGNREVYPIKLFSSSRGITEYQGFVLNSLFTPLQNVKITENLKNDKINKKIFQLSAADAVAVPLIRGDFEYSASGTVTYVSKNKEVYMFGHPFFNLGTVEFPMHKAEVISVMRSYNSSFKLAATRHEIGMIRQDRTSGIYGKLGEKSAMIPMKIFLKQSNSSVNLEMVRHPLLTPSLTAIALNSSFSSLFKNVGFQTLKVKGRIYLENEPDVVIDDFYSGTNCINEFSNMMMVINFFLMNNKDKYVKIQKIDFNIETSEEIKTSKITRVLINKNKFLENELIKLKIFYKKERGVDKKEEFEIRTPNIGPGKRFYVLVGGKKAISEFDSKNIKTSFFPSKLKYLVRAINNLRKSNRIYIKVFIPQDGVYLNGQEYTNMPDTEQNLFKTNSVDFRKHLVRYSTITEYQSRVDSVIEGQKILMLETKEQ